jgi:hypothetical protein
MISRRRILARAILVATPPLLVLGIILLRRGSAERSHPERVHPSPPPASLHLSEHGESAPRFRPPSLEPPAAQQPTAADEETLLALISAAQRETDPAKRHERLVAVCLHWAGFDPPAAIALASELGLDPLDGQLVPNLAQQWAGRDFPAALAWAGRLPAGELRDHVYSRLAYECAQTDPAAATRLLTGMRSTGPDRDEAAITIVHAWALRDIDAARAWADGFPAGPLRERAGAELATITR